jgi:Bacterial protein of unknown function (DUF899)
MSLHSVRFPNESPSYRTSRDELLAAEVRLRKNIEEVAALRRKLPLGGELPQDYIFTEGASDLQDSRTEHKIRLSELFHPGKDTLAIYSYMYGPDMKAPCTSCTSILDGRTGPPRTSTRESVLWLWRNHRFKESAQLPASAAGTISECFPRRAPRTTMTIRERIPTGARDRRSMSSCGAMAKSITSITPSFYSLPGKQGRMAATWT